MKQHAREFRFRISDRDVDGQLQRLAAAREISGRQLEEIKQHVARVAGADHAYMFDAQLLMLDDPMLLGRAADLVRSERLNAEWALRRAADEVAALFDEIEDQYLHERKGDLTDVVGRLGLNLRGGSGPADLLRGVSAPCVLVADDLPPSVAAQIDWTQVLGFATDVGSWTYHTAILARSLRVPAVVGLRDASDRIPPGSRIVVDGSRGELIVDPTPAVLAEVSAEAAPRGPRAEDGHEPAITTDGVRVVLEANIEFLEDVTLALEAGADGIGLFRSEYLLARGSVEPLAEGRQYEMYRRLLEGMAPKPVTIRTFDVGDEAVRADWQDDAAQRPGPGLHAIRLSLARRDLFRAQLRALFRASRHGELRIMFPFLSSVSELRQARAVLHETGAEVTAAGGPLPHVPVGVMIELPSAVLTADLLAPEVDFFSVGTNDLIQYALAVNRTDDRVSHLYEPLHPGILRAIRLVRRAARARRIPLAVCGEMAADPVCLAVLIGLGVTKFSMTPAAIPASRRMIRGLHAGELRAIAREAMRVDDVETTRRRIVEHMRAAADGRKQGSAT
jgi:phosphotransferase system enzyme I (PtsI)